MASYNYTFQSGDGVTPTRLNDARTVSDIVNADIKSDAAIAFSKLAALNSAQILVGNGSNVPTAVSVTGDVTISNAGVTAIAAGAVVTADVANAAITPAKLSQPYTLATAQASTSGTAIDFTGIPSWVKRVTVMFGAVSLSGTEDILLQIGSGSLATSGYVSTSSFLLGGSSSGSVNSSSGIVVYASSAANTLSAAVTLSLLGSNTWVATGLGVFPNNGAQVFTAGRVALSGALDRLRVTNTAANTFDAGTISISYEG